MPEGRQRRCISAVENSEEISLTSDYPDLATKSTLVGWTIQPDGTWLPTDLAPYRGSTPPPCGLHQWNHHLSELLNLEYPCAEMSLHHACEPPPS
ncbi:MAG TPA: hypothetical protein VK386_06960 [Acidimicrobiales bacterium]|nr:hypothetical protein [Acidimicrobiales bacterium]